MLTDLTREAPFLLYSQQFILSVVKKISRDNASKFEWIDFPFIKMGSGLRCCVMGGAG
jgi:hypothetical protein